MLQLIDGTKRVEHEIAGTIFILKTPVQGTRIKFQQALRVGVKLEEKYLDDFAKDQDNFKIETSMIKVDYSNIEFDKLSECIAETIEEIKYLPEKYKELSSLEIVNGLTSDDYWSLVGEVRKLLTLSDAQKKSSES